MKEEKDKFNKFKNKRIKCYFKPKEKNAKNKDK